MSHPQQTGQGSEGYAPPRADFSIMRVLSTVLVLVAIAGGGYAAFQFLGPGGSKLVKVRGRILWKGEPVTIGAVMTEHLEDRTQAALGALDKEGRFELDTNGELGAMPGEHKLAVASFIPAGAAPIPAVPAQYTSIQTTPIRVRISTNPENDLGDIILEGDLPERRRRSEENEAASSETADDDAPAEQPASGSETPSAENPARETPETAPTTETPSPETPDVKPAPNNPSPPTAEPPSAGSPNPAPAADSPAPETPDAQPATEGEAPSGTEPGETPNP